MNVPTVDIRVGDCMESLRGMASGSVQCVVTSPPYWGLRDYKLPPSVWEPIADGKSQMADWRACAHEWADETVTGELRRGLGLADSPANTRGGAKKCAKVGNVTAVRGSCVKCGAWRGCLGLEPTPEMFIAHMVAVFREVRRVLREDGTLWMNLGDSFASQGGSHGGRADNQRGVGAKRTHEAGGGDSGARTAPAGLKPKDLCGIPWRVALALQADGWWLRSDIIWAKPNPMPESVTDRPTKAHEYIFLLTKSAEYFYDHEAIKEGITASSIARISQPGFSEQAGGEKDYGTSGVNPNRSMRKTLENFAGKNRKRFRGGGAYTGDNAFDNSAEKENEVPGNGPNLTGTRNKRSVWTVATAPFSEAHFATFPPKLIEPCILAGTSAAGCCAACGSAFERVIERGAPDLAHQRACGGDVNGEYHGEAQKDFAGAQVQDASAVKARILAGMRERKTVEWMARCKCVRDAGRRPCVVLDPFGGSGTTGMVALEHGRSAVLLELNPAYADMARRRCAVTPGLGL